jgi:penicillin amidase
MVLLMVAAAALGLIAVLSGLFLYVYWRLVQRPTPSLDGRAILAELDAPVEVLRDRHGIPHLYAASRADLFRAQGYIHAQDRLWQMEQNRRIAAGRLAEVYGGPALDADRFSRIVGFRRAAVAELAVLDDDTRQIIEWYVAGVNAFIQMHPSRLAAEFNLLRVTPEPWTILDVLAYAKVVAWSISSNWESELTRLHLVEALGPVGASELEPDYPAANPVILEALERDSAVRLLSTAGLLLNEYEKVRGWLAQPAAGMGSNSWVIAPKHTTTRRAYLCNDPHLAVQLPQLWYENRLACPDLEVSGASIPGVPGVVIGHNAHVAWGITNAYVDQQDLYVERAHPDDPQRFAYGEGWEQATIIEEPIRVRQRAAAHVERVAVTRHGPLISNFLQGTLDAVRMPLALRWTGHEPGQNARAILRLNMAQGWEDFRTALADWAAPANVFTYADVDGNIGALVAGQVPLRRHNLGLTPAPGWDGQHEWDGWVAPAELPQLYNPPSGLIVTANNKIVGDSYHHFLGVDFQPGWRAAAIEEMLREKERFAPRDMEAMQLDVRSKYAQTVAPLFARLNSDEPFVKVALDYLRKWDHHMEPDSTGAVIFQYALAQLLDEVFGRRLGPLRPAVLGIGRSPFFPTSAFALRAATKLAELLPAQVQSHWYADVASGRPRSRDEVLFAVLTEAVRRLRADLGDNARRWHWGRVHQLRYVHPLGSRGLFRGLFTRGPLPVGGDATTVNQTYHAPVLPLGLVQIAAGYRQVFEVGAWDQARTVTQIGQSGHPMSEHFADQMHMWLEGAYHAMPWSREAVESAARYRLVLLPTG